MPAFAYGSGFQPAWVKNKYASAGGNMQAPMNYPKPDYSPMANQSFAPPPPAPPSNWMNNVWSGYQQGGDAGAFGNLYGDLQNPGASIRNNIFPIWSQQLGHMAGLQDNRESTINQALQQLSPGGLDGLIQAFGQRQNAGVDDQARQYGNTLRGAGIFGQDAAARLSAQNNAADATNQYSQQMYDPSQMAQRAMQSLGFMSPEMVMPILGPLFQAIDSSHGLMNARVNERQASGSGLGGALGGLLGSMGGFGGLGGLGALFGGGGIPQAGGLGGAISTWLNSGKR